MSSSNITPLANYLQQSNVVLVILPKKPTFDQQLAAASLHLSLIEGEKKSQLLAVNNLVNPTIAGLDALKTEVGANNLVIGFEYDAQAVDNVSYHLDEESNKFYLTIKPQKGHNPLDKDSLQIEYAGADADTIVVYGVEDLEELEQLFLGYEELYQGANIISIGESNPSFQASYLNTGEFSSYCEATFELLQKVSLTVSAEMATNLLAGIQYQTDNYIDLKADANTFEAVAALLRLGARRKAGAFSSSLEKSGNSLKEGGGADGGEQALSSDSSQEDEGETALSKSNNSTAIFSQSSAESSAEKKSNKSSDEKSAKTKQEKKKSYKPSLPLRPGGLK